MINVYIDVTCYRQARFMSGIQRVVREIAGRFLSYPDIHTVLLEYDPGRLQFRVLQGKETLLSIEKAADRKEAPLREGGEDDAGDDGMGEKAVASGGWLLLHDMKAGDVFFDVDAVWETLPKRAVLYPRLKQLGVIIIPFIQDILPITHPEYFAPTGSWNFAGFLEACLQDADEILVTTNATKDEVVRLNETVGVSTRKVSMFVTGLGADFGDRDKSGEKENPDGKEQRRMNENVDPDVREFVHAHPDYVLMVGTIEPRKNHKVILDAFEQKLFGEGRSLVFAGRIGWNNSDLLDRMQRDAREQKGFAFFRERSSRNIDYLYQNAGMVVFPSFEEGYGLPIIEAMHFGVPVIAGDRPVLREVGGESCLFCDVSRPDDWIRTMERMYSDPEFYREQKEKAAAYVPRSWDEVGEKIYGEVLRVSREKPDR